METMSDAGRAEGEGRDCHASRLHRLKDELFSDLTTKEVCTITGLDRSTVLKYLTDGTIEGYHLGKSWRVPVGNLRTFKEHLQEEARRTAAAAHGIQTMERRA